MKTIAKSYKFGDKYFLTITRGKTTITTENMTANELREFIRCIELELYNDEMSALYNELSVEPLETEW